MDTNHPVSESMKSEIVAQIQGIESAHDVKVLYACESGSRGWGFASPDSDYDVRFLYVHPLAWYLRVRAQRDIIEQPISGDLDINGWELRKALGEPELRAAIDRLLAIKRTVGEAEYGAPLPIRRLHAK